MAGRLGRDCSIRILFHALLMTVLLGGTAARAEDGGQDPLNEPYVVQVGATKLTINPTAPPEPDMNAVAEHIGQFQHIWNEHDRTDAAAEEAERTALQAKYGAQNNLRDEPSIPLIPGEPIEDFKKRSLDASAAWQTAHGKPVYRVRYDDGEEGLASFDCGGITCTREEYLAGMERNNRQRLDRKRDLDDFSGRTKFGLQEGQPGYDTDEVIEQRKKDAEALEAHLAQEVERKREETKTYRLPDPARTLVSKEGEKAPEPR